MRNSGVKNYAVLPPVDEGEALRYAGVRREVDAGVKALLLECEKEVERILTPRVCYRFLSKDELSAIRGSRESRALAKALQGCDRVLLFAATVGIGLDRLLLRYGETAPSKALFCQALGAERIEALCDVFCTECERTLAGEGGYLERRFSAGYGDFPLSAQKDIFRLLDCPRQIGLTLTDSLLMSPTKSVTAIVGVGALPMACKTDCSTCRKEDCEYRK